MPLRLESDANRMPLAVGEAVLFYIYNCFLMWCVLMVLCHNATALGKQYLHNASGWKRSYVIPYFNLFSKVICIEIIVIWIYYCKAISWSPQLCMLVCLFCGDDFSLQQFCTLRNFSTRPQHFSNFPIQSAFFAPPIYTDPFWRYKFSYQEAHTTSHTASHPAPRHAPPSYCPPKFIATFPSNDRQQAAPQLLFPRAELSAGS